MFKKWNMFKRYIILNETTTVSQGQGYDYRVTTTGLRLQGYDCRVTTTVSQGQGYDYGYSDGKIR